MQGLSGSRCSVRSSTRARRRYVFVVLRSAREFVRPSYRKSQLLKLLASSTSSTHVHAEPRPHGSSPLIVLTAGYPNTAGTMIPAHQRAIWVAEVHVHDRIAALSSRGINFVVEGSGHHIPEERPVRQALQDYPVTR